MKKSGSGSESGSISQRHGSADPDPHQNVMDPQQNVMDPQHWLKEYTVLIRWIEERRSRRKLLDEEDLYVRNEEEVNNIFFAYQVIIIKLRLHLHRGSASFFVKPDPVPDSHLNKKLDLEPGPH
jgi:hypothetical protein